MNAVFGASIKLPANQSKILAAIRFGSANELSLAKNILARITKLPGAMAGMVAGPSMSERARYSQKLAETRVSNLEGLASAWCRPH